MRPRSHREILVGYDLIKVEDAKRRRKPLIVLAVLAVVGASIYWRHQMLRSGAVALEGGRTASHAVADNTKAVVHYLAGHYSENTFSPLAPPAYVERTEAPPASPARAAAPEARPSAEEPERTWEIKGRVYELVNLHPAAGFKLVFKDKTSGRSTVVLTDAKGGFSAILPKLEEGGYEVLVILRGKPRAFIEDNMRPLLRGQSTDRRRETAEELLRHPILHVPILLKDQDSKEYNIALLPAGG